jgi:hypothetical protein
MRESIEPEDGVGHEANEHETGETLKGERVVAAASPVFDDANEALNFGNVFFLCTEVGTDMTKGGLKRFNFRVSKNGHNMKSATMIYLEQTGEATGHGRNLTVGQVLYGSEV